MRDNAESPLQGTFNKRYISCKCLVISELCRASVAGTKNVKVNLMKIPSKQLLLITGLAIASSLGCTASAQTSTNSTNYSSTSENKGDADANAITPLSQSNAQDDLDVTQSIRKAIVAEKGLSVDAQNIKIITTTQHVVYLKGVVDSEEERQRIMALAKPLAGERTIKNHLKLPQETHKI
jgi:hypothetical protein